MDEKEKDSGAFFSAKLKLRDISKKVLTYRIYTDGMKGSAIINQEHITINRIFFPVDDDFNMDFMSSDLSGLKASGDVKAEDIRKIQRKQAEFRKCLEFDLIIK
jgi:hypothetical protein